MGQADVDDICQDVLVRLLKAMKSFAYDPRQRFRGWLRMVVVHAISDYFAAWPKGARGSGDSRVLEVLRGRAAADDLATRIADAFDQEHLERALSFVERRVQPHNWQAFVRTTLRGQPVADVAREMGLHAGMIYVARSNIQKMLRSEIERLEVKSSTVCRSEELADDGTRRLSHSRGTHAVPGASARARSASW
jgi:RNA polymerase sigma-70 factor (ECF subfamily)